MIAVQEYLDAGGRSAYRTWFDALDVAAATRVAVALERLAEGHQSSLKALGEGVSEYKINFGPGYRIYFGKDGERLVILLGGGTKKRQDRDIEEAKALWREYKQRKKSSTRPATKSAKRKRDN